MMIQRGQKSLKYSEKLTGEGEYSLNITVRQFLRKGTEWRLFQLASQNQTLKTFLEELAKKS